MSNSNKFEINELLQLLDFNMDDSIEVIDFEIQDSSKTIHFRKKLVPVLKTLWSLCGTNCTLDSADVVPNGTTYPLTADKVLRMYHCAIDNGFTSFSEA